MFNFKLNSLKLIYENLPFSLHAPKRINMLKVMLKPFKVIHADFIKAKDEFIYKCTFNGEVLYLQTALNDKFDLINRGITIVDSNYDPLYIYARSESKPPIMMYARWKSTINFATNDFCVTSTNRVYQANAPTTGSDVPGVSSKWDLTTRTVPILRARSNFNGTITFNVNVPSTVSFNLNEMKALINYYKLAGKGYQINII